MAKKKINFESYINDEENKLKDEPNEVKQNVFDAEKALENEQTTENLLESKINSLKFLSNFSKIELDKGSKKVNYNIYSDNSQKLDLLATVLKDHKKIYKVDLLNYIVSSFFEKNKKDLKEIFELYTKNKNVF